MEKSKSRFPLSDILPVPIQRVMRYPLLIKELEKSAKKAMLHSQVAQTEKLIGLLEVRATIVKGLKIVIKININMYTLL